VKRASFSSLFHFEVHLRRLDLWLGFLCEKKKKKYIRRFIRSRYILLSVLILLLEEGAQFWQKSSGVV
jgi:hypothetical protein